MQHRSPGSPPLRSSTINSPGATNDAQTHIVDMLIYIRSCFEEETILDRLPFEAAGNAGAWYAWRAYRAKAGVKFADMPPNLHRRQQSKERAAPRHPSEWNWEGVWMDRARKAVQASLSESALYGSSGAGRDDEVHFRPWGNESEEAQDVQNEMRYHLRLHE